MTIDGIIEDFALLDDWEDRYRYVIELGKQLSSPARKRNGPPPTRSAAVPARSGWRPGSRARATMPRLHFAGDSDAHIVRGLVAIAIALFDGKTAREIVKTDAQAVFDGLGLSEHLTAQRSNGLKRAGRPHQGRRPRRRSLRPDSLDRRPIVRRSPVPGPAALIGPSAAARESVVPGEARQRETEQ